MKWAGGKRKLVETIRRLLPPDMNRYVEPFVGAGSVALNVMAKSIHIGDINADLILTWHAVQLSACELIEECRLLFDGSKNNEKSYYALREEFNHAEYSFRKAALFIYLNRHGFNGMCRYSAGGTFNIPFGKYASVELPVNKILAVSAVIKDWHMSDMDFRTTMAQLNPGDVAYCDPPYVPEQQVKQATAFTAYSKENFSIDDQISLANAAGAAAQRGVTIIISNHDTKFTRNLYEERGGVLVKTRTKRSIASKSENRKEASELLVVFRPNSRNRPSRSRLKMHEYPADVKSEINDVIYRTESESALEIEPEE